MKLASLEAIARALNAANLPFVVVGGLAVVAHGYSRQTHDVDLVVDFDPESVHGVFRALAGIGYHPQLPVTAAQFADPAERARWIREKHMAVLAFFSNAHPETPIDLFVIEPFNFAEEYAKALIREIAPGVPIRLIRLEGLLALKRLAGRPQDLADIAELEAVPERTDD